MALLRKLAVRWLRAVVRNAPPACREWASAMLRELDFIESDWAALLWALGSTAAISRHWLRAWHAWIRGREEEQTMKDTAMKVAGLLLGVLIAVAGAAGAFGMLVLVIHFLPAFQHQGLPWPAWMLALVLETLLVVGTVRLWSRRRPMAIGILLAAGILGTHFVMHIASHWNG
jgi:hypothetical protein